MKFAIAFIVIWFFSSVDALGQGKSEKVRVVHEQPIKAGKNNQPALKVPEGALGAFRVEILTQEPVDMEIINEATEDDITWHPHGQFKCVAPWKIPGKCIGVFRANDAKGNPIGYKPGTKMKSITNSNNDVKAGSIDYTFEVKQ